MFHVDHAEQLPPDGLAAKLAKQLWQSSKGIHNTGLRICSIRPIQRGLYARVATRTPRPCSQLLLTTCPRLNTTRRGRDMEHCLDPRCMLFAANRSIKMEAIGAHNMCCGDGDVRLRSFPICAIRACNARGIKRDKPSESRGTHQQTGSRGFGAEGSPEAAPIHIHFFNRCRIRGIRR